jgi:cellulose synthase/poly-beta-1,6-N-acetylglucosamine synthase-like glycosyltransferase
MTVVIVCLAFLVPATVACLYYFLLTTIGWKRSPLAPREVSGFPLAEREGYRFAVIIPAHDEELGLPATLRSVFDSDYPADRLRVLVVADNCTDGTAEVARRHGAECLERHDPINRGKGHALALAIPHALAAGAEAVVVLDADCELPTNALRAFDRALAAGAEAVQAARVPRNAGDGPAALVSAVGSAIENAVSTGKCRLGGSAALRGSGMAFTRGLLEQHPWASFGLTEDAEYGALLARAGVRVHFLQDVEVTGEVPADAATLARQRTRWRASLYDRGPGLFARWLASKPLVLAHLALTLMVVAGLSSWMPTRTAMGFAVWGGLLVALNAVVYLRAMRRTGVAGLRGLGTAAGIAMRLAWVTLAGLADRGRPWERTKRVAEQGQL